MPMWTLALGDESGATFREVAAPHVRLEGRIFATPTDDEMGRRLGNPIGPGVFDQAR